MPVGSYSPCRCTSTINGCLGKKAHREASGPVVVAFRKHYHCAIRKIRLHPPQAGRSGRWAAVAAQRGGLDSALGRRDGAAKTFGFPALFRRSIARPAYLLSTLRGLPRDGPTHDLGPCRIATPYLVGDFHPCALPSLTGAFNPSPFVADSGVALIPREDSIISIDSRIT